MHGECSALGWGQECYNQRSGLESEKILEDWPLPRILGSLTSRWFAGSCPWVTHPRGPLGGVGRGIDPCDL